MNTKNIIILTSVVTITSIMAYFLLKKKSEKREQIVLTK